MHDAGAGGGVDLAGADGADVGAGVAEVGVVKGVEHFPAVLEFAAFGEAEAFEEGEVEVVTAGSDQDVAAEVAISAEGGDGEGGGVELSGHLFVA